MIKWLSVIYVARALNSVIMSVTPSIALSVSSNPISRRELSPSEAPRGVSIYATDVGAPGTR